MEKIKKLNVDSKTRIARLDPDTRQQTFYCVYV